MDATLITLLVKDIAVPEILALIHRTVQDDQTIQITLSKDVAAITQAGQAFLDETRPIRGGGSPSSPASGTLGISTPSIIPK